ncbi:MAG: cytochrome c [Caldilineales bacterium]|nr:cytochrome c [Caldilineales bacterium]MCW5860324.1 cytochrome c [Caldilineales bacterium]
MRKITIIVLLLALAALLIAACGGGGGNASEPVAVAKGDATKGQELFGTTCAACHGPKGEGVTGLGKDMTTSTFIAGLADDQLLEFVKKGRDTSDPANTTGVAMPPKGGNPALTDEQLLDIIAYIRTIHKN